MSIFKKSFESFYIKYKSVFKFGINFVSPAPAQPEEVTLPVSVSCIAPSRSKGFVCSVVCLDLTPGQDMYGDYFYAFFISDK